MQSIEIKFEDGSEGDMQKGEKERERERERKVWPHDR
jgi:hypothetical protein